MNTHSHTKQVQFDNVFRLLESLEKRIGRIEDYLEIELHKMVKEPIAQIKRKI